MPSINLYLFIDDSLYTSLSAEADACGQNLDDFVADLCEDWLKGRQAERWAEIHGEPTQ
jgi:hypothetical protein